MVCGYEGDREYMDIGGRGIWGATTFIIVCTVYVFACTILNSLVVP